MRKSRYTYLIKTISILCLVTMLFSSCGADVNTKSIIAKSLNIQVAENKGDSLHKADLSNYESVCSSGLIEMLFDKYPHVKKEFIGFPENWKEILEA